MRSGLLSKALEEKERRCDDTRELHGFGLACWRASEGDGGVAGQ